MSNTAGNITSGLKDKGIASNFKSDDTAYTIATDGGGEAYLHKGPDNTANSWTMLQDAVTAATDGKLIQLTGDVVNTNNAGPIIVNGNKKITIDLNGYAVNRNRTSETGNGHVFELKDGATLIIRDSKGGGTITGGYANNGGGIYINKDCTCIITGGSVTGNNADDDGGGILVKGTLKMTGGSVSRNFAKDNGGGIYVSDTGAINLLGADISYNTAKGDGGGLKVLLSNNNSSTITRSKITNNKAIVYGGGLHMDASGKTLTIVDTAIDHNESTDDGAGIYLRYGTIVMNGGSLSDNFAHNDGGGAKITKGTTFTANGVSISNNTSRDEEGGGVKNFGITTLTDCTISFNNAKKSGGGVFNDDDDGSKGELTLEGCTIIGNRTKKNGGGVYSDHKLTIVGGNITGNSASDRGGGVFIGDDSDDTSIGGNLVVKNNGAVVKGNDIFLRTHKLAVTSALTEDAEIGITKENDDGIDVFTTGYSNFNGNTNPSESFFSPEGLEVTWAEHGEAKLATSWPALQDLITNAPDRATIKLEGDLGHNFTASAKDTYLEIPKNKVLTIDLNGYTLNRNRTSSDGDGHVFWVKEGASLTLKDSTASETGPGKGTITGGYSKRGGGIYVDEGATCTIRGINITNNKASDDGAGIYSKGILDIENSVISRNIADDCGGGIDSEKTGSVKLNNVAVTGNIADGDKGGGLFLYLAADATIMGGEISNNHAGDEGGGFYMDAGGRTLAITGTKIDENSCGDDGAGFIVNKGAVVMEHGSVSKNAAANDSGGVKIEEDGSFTARNVEISDNKAKAEEGGGVKNYGTATFESCTIKNNSSTKQGGGFYNDGNLTLTNCEVSNNSSANNGGGIYSEGVLAIAGGVKAKITGNSSEALGDGVYIDKDATETSIKGAIEAADNGKCDVFLGRGKVLKLTDAITGTSIGTVDMESIGVFTEGYGEHYDANTEPNTFFCKGEGAIPAEWNEEKTEARLHSYWPELQAEIDAAANGDVVTLQRDYTAGSSDISLEIRDGYNVTIDLNGHKLNRNLKSARYVLTNPDGTVVRVNGVPIAISNFGIMGSKDVGHVIAIDAGGTLTITDSTATESEAGKGIITGGYASKGGGIYIENNGTLYFQAGSIVANTATDHGGGILNYGALNMTGGMVAKNSAEGNGGGIYSSDSSYLNLYNAFIFENIAGDHGGGLNIRLKSDTAVINNCTITGNSAAENGGGLRLDAKGKTLNIINSQINGNTAIDDGAGIYLNSGTINMEGGSLSENGTHNDGGGAKITEGTGFTATGVDIKDNKALTEEGGGVKNVGITTLDDCTISGNRAAKQGGGVFNDYLLTLKNCTVKGNSTHQSGGGVYSAPGYLLNGIAITPTMLTIDSGEISGNTADERGGGVFVGASSVDTRIQGSPKINGNTASEFGDDLFMDSSQFPNSATRLALTGALVDATDIHVDMQTGTGVLTKNYKQYNGTDEPTQYFSFAKGYYTKLDADGEVEICSDWPTIKSKIENAADGATITLDKDYAAAASDDRIKTPKNKSITIDLNGFTLNRNRSSKDDDGHVLEVLGTLVLKDGSTAETGTITGGWAKRGGGINIGDNGVLDLQGGTISGNRATDGGGIFAHNVLNMSGGTIKDNAAEKDGGGIDQGNGSTLNLTGGNVTANDAGVQGGGINVSNGANARVADGPVVFGNHASKNGHDLYLPSRGALTVSGPFAKQAKLGVSLTDDNATGGKGRFTSGYSLNNPGADPASTFVSMDGYAVYLDDAGEAALETNVFGKSQYADPFISAKNQVNTDTSTLTSKNWMSGISGERRLNEINTPGSHDSGMNNVTKYYNTTAEMVASVTEIALAGLSAVAIVGGLALAPFTGGASMMPALFLTLSTGVFTVAYMMAVPKDYTNTVSTLVSGRAADLAKTQKEYIYQQLEEGARQLDVRLNNRKKVYKFLDVDDGIFNGWMWEDDGKNLWLCHGKAGGGTYQAEDPDDHYLSLGTTLMWVKEFLKEHPTETIVLDLRPETEDKEYTRTIYERTRKILEAETLQINPSTNEPYLYKEPGSDDFFARYTEMPKLADCRGKIVVMGYDDEYCDYIGGFTRQGLTAENLDELDYQNTDSMMVSQIKEVFGETNGDGHIGLPTEADAEFDRLWYWETNCTGQKAGDLNYYVTMDAPHKLAEYVNDNIFGGENTFSANNAGQYIGWVKMDSFAAPYAEEVWRTNFFEGLEYRTVTVKSGLDVAKYPDQTFQVLKGTKLTVPGNIYKDLENGKYLGGWTAKGVGDAESVDYMPGDVFSVDENVEFTAQWLEGQIPIKIEWKDGDNADNLRPNEVNVFVSTGSTDVPQTLALQSDKDWRGIVDVGNSDGDSVTITPDWYRVDTTGGQKGQDTEGQYRYEINLANGDGYTLSLIHTPQDKVSASGAITWNDKDNAEGKRPASATVRLFKNGTQVESTVVNENGQWRYDFGQLAQYEDGVKVEYAIAEDPIDYYSTVVDGFSIVNYYDGGEANSTSVVGMTQWDDGGDAFGKRPASVSITLKANDVDVETRKISSSNGDVWNWSFVGLPGVDPQGNDIIYTVTAEEVPGYHVSYESVEDETDSDTPPLSGQSEGQKPTQVKVVYTLDVDKSQSPSAVVSVQPDPLDRVYNTQEQTLVNEGEAEGGKLVYALGANATNAPDADSFSSDVPVGTDAGTYYVWCRAKGDVLHTDSDPQCVQAVIEKADQTIDADDVEGAVGEFGKAVTATATAFGGVTEGVGALSYTVASGTNVAQVDESSGNLTLLAPGTATVKVTAAETRNYHAATKDVTVTVAPTKYTVTFYEDTEGTKIWRTETLDGGSSLAGLANYGTGLDPLVKVGYTFAGWVIEPGIEVNSYLDLDGNLNKKLVGKLVDWNGTIEGDIDAYPIWIRDRLEVHLEANDDEADPVIWGADDGVVQSPIFIVNIDEKIRMAGLISTTRAGYKLDGWYTQGGVKWNGDWGVTPAYCDKGADGNPIVQVNADRKFRYYTVTLTARWTPVDSGQDEPAPDGEDHTITFNSVGGSPVAPITQKSGTVIAPPANPTKDHYTFGGWHPALPTEMPSEDLDLTASWRPKMYTITFEDTGETAVSPISDIYGAKVEAPANPLMSGSVFGGWLDEDGDAVAFPLYMPGTDMTLWAKWKTVQSAPSVTVEAVDSSTVNVANPVAGAEYVLMPAGQEPTAKDWVNAKRAGEGGVSFGGLAPVTDYDVYARMFETDDAAQSDAAKASVTTLKLQQGAPEAPVARAVGENAIAVEGASDVREYALVPKGEPAPAADSDAWRSPNADGAVTWTDLATDAEYDVYARNKETADTYASPASQPTTVALAHTHDWGEPAYTWSDDKSTCTATRTCKLDASHVETAEATVTFEETKAPTATEAGERTYTATFDVDWAETQTATRTVDPTGPEDAIAYRATKGDATWVKGSGVALSFTFKRSQDDTVTFDHFIGVSVDGSELPEDIYAARSGSVVIELSPDYLETLALGAHSLQPMFDDGVGEEVTFTVVKPSKPGTDPEKDDPSTNPDSGTKPAPSADSGNGAKTAPAAAKGSSTSPKTGDALPVAAVSILLIAGLVVALIARRKAQSGGGR